MPLTSGTRLGRYEVRSQIGSGGMGEVYLAQDLNLRRSVALKLLPAEFTQNEDRLRRFEQEACNASSLNHPNILPIHEIGSEGDAHFIATEFIDGESLRQHMSRGETNLREMLDIVVQVASALTAAHEAGIVHRDIKPENIMVRRDGYVKVLDFGLAKLVERQVADSEAATMVNTDPGVVMGTASYMSPEQARGLDMDARTDIWSLGVVIYEMMAGRVPFAGTTTGDTLGLILGERSAPPLSRFAHEVPSELERIVTKALTKEREERYQTVKDLALDLKSIRRQLEVEAEIERTVPPKLRAGTSEIPGGRAAVDIEHQSASAPTSSAQYLVGEIKRHKFLGVRGYIDPAESRRQAEAAAHKALVLDENLAEAHVAIGRLYADFVPYDFAISKREIRRALELSPSLALAHQFLGISLVREGKRDESMEPFLRARQLDPLSPTIARQAALTPFLKRDYVRPLEVLRQTEDLGRLFTTHWEIGIYVQNGLYEETLMELANEKLERTNDPILIYDTGIIYAAQGRRADALQIIKELAGMSGRA